MLKVADGDVCDEPEYCIPNTAACDDEPRRLTMEIETESLCPHLITSTGWVEGRNAVGCWDQEDEEGKEEQVWERTSQEAYWRKLQGVHITPSLLLLIFFFFTRDECLSASCYVSSTQRTSLG